MLQDTLDEHCQTDKKLTDIAESINDEANTAGDEEEQEKEAE